MGGIVPAAKKAEAAESRALLERGKPLVFGQHPDKGDVAKLLAGRESWTVDGHSDDANRVPAARVALGHNEWHY